MLRCFIKLSRRAFVLACLVAFPTLAAEKPAEPAVIFSPAGGAFATNVTLQLSTRETTATIRFTLDGS